MLTITITLIDPDFDYSLPARWGTDYKVSAIQGCFLNGATALVLSLSPLKDENLPEFSQGCCRISSDSGFVYCQYNYIDVLRCAVPLAIGSSFGTLYQVSEVKQVVTKQWKLHQDQWQSEWCLCWRYTLAPRRDPILLLSSAKYNVYYWEINKLMNPEKLRFTGLPEEEFADEFEKDESFFDNKQMIGYFSNGDIFPSPRFALFYFTTSCVEIEIEGELYSLHGGCEDETYDALPERWDFLEYCIGFEGCPSE